MATLLRPGEEEMRHALHGVGDMNEKDMFRQLEQWKFSTTGKGRGFVITAERNPESSVWLFIPIMVKLTSIFKDNPPQSQLSEQEFWRPILLHPISQIAVILILFGTIIALELLYRHSFSNDGIASISTMFGT
jgi:hypothetical protein